MLKMVVELSVRAHMHTTRHTKQFTKPSIQIINRMDAFYFFSSFLLVSADVVQLCYKSNKTHFPLAHLTASSWNERILRKLQFKTISILIGKLIMLVVSQVQSGYQ